MQLALNGVMRQFVPWHSGWKTYLVCAVGVVMGVLQGLDQSNVVHIHIPTFVNWVLLFLGGAALRNSVSVRSAYIVQTVYTLLKIMAEATTIPAPAAEAPQASSDGLTGNMVRTEPVTVGQLAPARSFE